MEVKNLRKELVNTITASMKGRDNVWEKTWSNISSTEAPYNPITGTKYSGVNLLALSLKQTELDTHDPRWCTFKQAVEAGFKINKDSKAAHASFYDMEVNLTHDDKKTYLKAKSTPEFTSKIIGYYKNEFPDKAAVIEDTAKKAKAEMYKQNIPDRDQFKTIVDELNKATGAEIKLFAGMALKSFAIFNYSQLQNVPDLEIKPMDKKEAIQRAEGVVIATGAKIINHKEADNNFYNPSNNEIHLKTKESFKTPEAYYSTVMQEVAHWTNDNGLPLNLVHEGEDKSSHNVHTRSELRAELANIFMSKEIGLNLNIQDRPSHAGPYIELLDKNPNEFFAAVTDAHKIATHILDFEKRLDLKSSQSQELQAKNPELYEKIAAFKIQEINQEIAAEKANIADSQTPSNVVDKDNAKFNEHAPEVAKPELQKAADKTPEKAAENVTGNSIEDDNDFTI